MKKSLSRHASSATPPHFAILAADVALFTIKDSTLLVRLIGVHRPPHFVDREGLPGGLIDPAETAEEAAQRILKTKTGLSLGHVYLEQLSTFSAVNRDPRGRVVAVAYLALVPWEALRATEQNGTPQNRWVDVEEARHLAYDHDTILHAAVERLQSRVTHSTLIGRVMPKDFTLTELERAYESIVKTSLDKRNFRKKILKLGVLKPLARKRVGGPFRPAQLYCFKSSKVQEIKVL